MVGVPVPWNQIAARAGLELTQPQVVLLSRFLDLLIDANLRMNLTRITDRPQAELQHVADALTLLPFLPREPHALVEVGSGGGSPGIPLAIARPDVNVLLIEATKKKAAYLQATIAALGLSNITVSDQRAEDVGHGKFRGTFDVAVARAVGELAFLVEWCLPLVKKGGRLLAMKGPRVHEEMPAALAALKPLGGSPPVIHPVDLPGTENHLIVEIIKTGPTDRRLPRPASVARGKPLA
jgi:16S rRNA (guanine527-N7)-methyltransferase